MSGVQPISIAGQVEKELEADIYINRNGQIMRAVLRSDLYQGDKGILLHQSPEAALRLTSHLFAFCGGSHQQAAAKALENAWQISTPPTNAILLRQIGQAAEILQNISRWFYSTFALDLTNEKYQPNKLYPTVCDRFAFMKGSSFHKGIMASSYPIQLYSIIAGHWPLADFVIPGGVSTNLKAQTLGQAFSVLEKYRTEWLEPIWLGCSLERYFAIHNWEELMEWLEEKQAHWNSDLGLFIRAALAYGWDKIRRGLGKFFSYGIAGTCRSSNDILLSTGPVPGGYFDGDHYHDLDFNSIRCQLGKGHLHFNYKGQMVEVGPLARQLMVAQPNTPLYRRTNGLILDMFQEKGPSVFLRTFARMHEAAYFFQKIQFWLSRLSLPDDFNVPFSRGPESGLGLGVTEAPRGALAHLMETSSKQIKNYHILAPTLVKINDGDEKGQHSALSEALKGVIVEDPNNPIEIGTIARSMDTCISCKVNLFKHRSEKKISTVPL